MTYYSKMRDFDVSMSSLNVFTLLSVRKVNSKLSGRGHEHHSQYRSIAEVYQHTIHIQQKLYTVAHHYFCCIVHFVLSEKQLLQN